MVCSFAMFCRTFLKTSTVRKPLPLSEQQFDFFLQPEKIFTAELSDTASAEDGPGNVLDKKKKAVSSLILLVGLMFSGNDH